MRRFYSKYSLWSSLFKVRCVEIVIEEKQRITGKLLFKFDRKLVLFTCHKLFEVAIRTAPVSQHSFAIRTVFVLHMRNKAMFNLFVRGCF